MPSTKTSKPYNKKANPSRNSKVNEITGPIFLLIESYIVNIDELKIIDKYIKLSSGYEKIGVRD